MHGKERVAFRQPGKVGVMLNRAGERPSHIRAAGGRAVASTDRRPAPSGPMSLPGAPSRPARALDVRASEIRQQAERELRSFEQAARPCCYALTDRSSTSCELAERASSSWKAASRAAELKRRVLETHEFVEKHRSGREERAARPPDGYWRSTVIERRKPVTAPRGSSCLHPLAAQRNRRRAPRVRRPRWDCEEVTRRP